MIEKEISILIVEDDKPTTEFLRSLVEDEFEGVKIESVDNGKDAFLLLKKHSFSLTLLDLVLSKKDGQELLLDLDQNKIIAPVIIITALNLLPDEINALLSSQSVAGIVYKPFDIDEFLQLAKKSLRQS